MERRQFRPEQIAEERGPKHRDVIQGRQDNGLGAPISVSEEQRRKPAHETCRRQQPEIVGTWLAPVQKCRHEAEQSVYRVGVDHRAQRAVMGAYPPGDDNKHRVSECAR